MITNEARRGWLKSAGLLMGGWAATAAPTTLLAQAKAGKSDPDDEISPVEDLMREHGILKRILLIYREVMNRIDSKRDFAPEVVMSAATLIRTFVEDYHEKLEEDYLFPRFRKANRLVDLVDILNRQHQKGRVLTDRTRQLATLAALKDTGQRANLRNAL